MPKAEDHDFLEELSTPYEIRLSDEAVYAYSEIPSKKIYDRIGFLIDFIGLHPYYGQPYEPYYRAATPPIPCRVFFCGHYGVYYNVDHESQTINVLAIEDERRNPLNRFEVL